ncbi:MAG: MFS transporter [Kiritimatiellae bacterium]|nr:MFS transporter [Kiritimatiellia bacterium]
MKTKPMLGRFSLYGFLKNQQYYDPFLILAFRQMGLSFFMIGILVGFRGIIVNLMEIPSGVTADLFGRRKAMILSFVFYIVSFVIFGLTGIAATHWISSMSAIMPLLFGAMFFFAIGDAFRTGTHKAMIFTWLRSEGREQERTKVYGYTRSWSKLGSALSVILAAIFVFSTSNFIYIFFFSIIPYVLGIINFSGYPSEVDGYIQKGISGREVMLHLKEALTVSVKQPPLRRLILESMGFEGFFKVVKDYLQPILKAAAVPLTAALLISGDLSEQQQAALLVGPVYFALYLLSALASRKAHILVDKHGSEDQTARWLWLISLLILVTLVPALYYGWFVVVIPGFILLYVLQNLWRPVLISRFDAYSDETMGATILSIESQAKSIATMIIAPGLGYAVDLIKAHGIGSLPFWPAAVFGVIVSLLFWVTAKTPSRRDISP